MTESSVHVCVPASINTFFRKMEIQGIFFFDPADRIYIDHFPGIPVVPGSVIIKAFLQEARKNGVAHPRAIRDFRFRRFVSPGEHAFTINCNPGKLMCRLFRNTDTDSAILVTGTIER